jgi:hypothetical protein
MAEMDAIEVADRDRIRVGGSMLSIKPAVGHQHGAGISLKRRGF